MCIGNPIRAAIIYFCTVFQGVPSVGSNRVVRILGAIICISCDDVKSKLLREMVNKIGA